MTDMMSPSVGKSAAHRVVIADPAGADAFALCDVDGVQDQPWRPQIGHEVSQATRLADASEMARSGDLEPARR